MSETAAFQEDVVIQKIKHFLPAQGPLKDFVHHNTLHGFQDLCFEQAVRRAAKIFGYQTSLSLSEYRSLYEQGKIDPHVLDCVILKRKGKNISEEWKQLLFSQIESYEQLPKTGKLRSLWKSQYKLDLDTIVHSQLFRILSSYLDQGISITKFPVNKSSFLTSIIEIEQNSFVSFFKTQRVRDLLMDVNTDVKTVLKILVKDESLYEQYLFDQQFAHQGWSGLVSAVESKPDTLHDGRTIRLRGLIILECLLEIDNLDYILGTQWKPLGELATEKDKVDLFEETNWELQDELLMMWQEAYEWTYFDLVLAGIKRSEQLPPRTGIGSFDSFFCIDDRSGSLRRYLEYFDPTCNTFGTPGHFALDMYYQPKDGKFLSKVSPPPVHAPYVIQEVSTTRVYQSDLHYHKSSHGLFRGWLISQTMGFWSAIQLMFNIFRPSLSPATSHSFSQMDSFSKLTVENRSKHHRIKDKQIGYNLSEMTDRVEEVLRGTGKIDQFAPLVYIVGHGSSTTNNTHYAGYDCGACSGRPGSVNARAFSQMANHSEVRNQLRQRGILIPETTEFVGAMHDTTRDEVLFFDEELLSSVNKNLHEKNRMVFMKALKANAKERSRRFEFIDSKKSLDSIYEKVKNRSVSLFEPRPELNHATNTLCLIGRKQMNDHLFLDRRAFLNSYNYELDPEGVYLTKILEAITPVCGGINLEYYFSRVDNEKLGAGSKLPHNVIGLFAVANGFDGDLRPGLPRQMIELHDPLRMMMVIEHDPEVVLKIIKKSAALSQWFCNEWMILAVLNPVENKTYRLVAGKFELYETLTQQIQAVTLEELFASMEETNENMPVMLIKG